MMWHDLFRVDLLIMLMAVSFKCHKHQYFYCMTISRVLLLLLLLLLLLDYNKKLISITVAIDNDDEISRNFWGYTKKVSRSSTPVLPSFDIVQGTTYFTNALKCINHMKVFKIPSWIPKLKEPNIPFNLSPPTYQEITRIIKRMKSSGLSCP